MHLSCCGTLATGPSRPTGPLPTSTATRPPILPSWPRGSRDVWDPLIASRLNPQVSADVSWCQLVGAAWLLNFIADLHSRHISTGWYEGNGSPFGCKGRQNDYRRWLPEVQPWHTSGRSQEDRSIPCCKITQKWVQSWHGPGCSQKAWKLTSTAFSRIQQNSAAALPYLALAVVFAKDPVQARPRAVPNANSPARSKVLLRPGKPTCWSQNIRRSSKPQVISAVENECVFILNFSAIPPWHRWWHPQRLENTTPCQIRSQAWHLHPTPRRLGCRN